MTNARSILRHKSTIKANKNNEHSNRKPKNNTRNRFKIKIKISRMKPTLKLPKICETSSRNILCEIFM